MQKGLYPATSNCENDSYLASIIADSVIMCDEVINTKKPATTNFNEKKQSVIKVILLTFLLIIIVLLIAAFDSYY